LQRKGRNEKIEISKISFCLQGVIMEVETIDKHLSTGLYFCYNILLYIVAIFMLRSMCYSAYHMISTPSNVYSLIRETSFFAYAICMIVALRSKKVSYAGLGLMLAIVAIILTPITLYLGWSSSGYWTSSEILKKIAFILAPYCISIFPVLKVRSHLQEREYIVKGSRLSWDLSSYLLKN